MTKQKNTLDSFGANLEKELAQLLKKITEKLKKIIQTFYNLSKKYLEKNKIKIVHGYFTYFLRKIAIFYLFAGMLHNLEQTMLEELEPEKSLPEKLEEKKPTARNSTKIDTNGQIVYENEESEESLTEQKNTPQLEEMDSLPLIQPLLEEPVVEPLVQPVVVKETLEEPLVQPVVVLEEPLEDPLDPLDPLVFKDPLAEPILVQPLVLEEELEEPLEEQLQLQLPLRKVQNRKRLKRLVGGNMFKGLAENLTSQSLEPRKRYNPIKEPFRWVHTLIHKLPVLDRFFRLKDQLVGIKGKVDIKSKLTGDPFSNLFRKYIWLWTIPFVARSKYLSPDIKFYFFLASFIYLIEVCVLQFWEIVEDDKLTAFYLGDLISTKPSSFFVTYHTIFFLFYLYSAVFGLLDRVPIYPNFLKFIVSSAGFWARFDPMLKGGEFISKAPHHKQSREK